MKRLRNDKGISLIELVVALAILSLLMIAVMALMNNNTIIFRKAKSDLKVQSQAQEAYNRISDVIMQAKNIYVEGYTVDSDVDFKSIKPGSAPVDINKNTVTLTPVTAYSYYDGINMATESTNLLSNKVVAGTINPQKIYLKKLVVVSTVALDKSVLESYITGPHDIASTGSKYYTVTGQGMANAPTNVVRIGGTDIELQDKAVNITSGEPNLVIDYNLSATHNILVGDTDRCIYTFYFDDGDIYMTTEYLYMFYLNSVKVNSDNPDDWTTGTGAITEAEKESLKIAEGLNYASAGSTKAEGAVAAFDGNKNAVQLTLYFNYNNMTFTVDDLISCQNSFVVKTPQ